MDRENDIPSVQTDHWCAAIYSSYNAIIILYPRDGDNLTFCCSRDGGGDSVISGRAFCMLLTKLLAGVCVIIRVTENRAREERAEEVGRSWSGTMCGGGRWCWWGERS